ncbi:membrane protein [Streptomyces sp. TUS-ST3]|nr:membrane protein [Streptomyces sp. TUS-ST3]
MNLPGGAVTMLRAVDSFVLSPARSDDEPPLTIPRDPAREAASRELSKRMYHENDPSWFQRALNAFWDWVDKLFNAASSATPGGPLGLVVVIAAVVLIVGALWWRLGTPRSGPASAAALFDDRPRSAADHRAAAEAHAAQGHWNQAVQERMRAIVRSLEERALLDIRPGRTADEAAAEAGRALPSHSDRLRSAARDFDDVTYGGRAATEQSYHRIAEVDRDLERTKPVLANSTSGTSSTSGTGGTGGMNSTSSSPSADHNARPGAAE